MAPPESVVSAGKWSVRTANRWNQMMAAHPVSPYFGDTRKPFSREHSP
jgi:hypothetical protein